MKKEMLRNVKQKGLKQNQLLKNKRGTSKAPHIFSKKEMLRNVKEIMLIY